MKKRFLLWARGLDWLAAGESLGGNRAVKIDVMGTGLKIHRHSHRSHSRSHYLKLA